MVGSMVAFAVAAGNETVDAVMHMRRAWWKHAAIV
jgi:hypothetical protein